ncbi:hypothetical protein C4556_01425 [Candidatus Parcubacteria bacterium]|nr:MAG: hypothetical protein C4556_01425 [Candidatus Parcubacteria bacterium]
MDWLRLHPYTLIAVAVSILVLAGAYVIQQRLGVEPDPNRTVAWGGFNGLLYPVDTSGRANTAAEQTLPDLYRDVQSGPPFWYSPPAMGDAGTEGDASTFDIEAFIAMLSEDSPNTGGDTGSVGAETFFDAYSFIPRGLIATSAPTQVFTESQQALHTYGNEAGSYIQVFEDRNRDMTRVLKDQFEDPEDALKRNALIGLAGSLAGVGESLENIQEVPTEARSANTKLAGSYRDMGAKLALVPNAGTEEELISAMLTYNAAVEGYVKNYVALVTLFSLAEVTFRDDEPGSVFMFSGGSGGF